MKKLTQPLKIHGGKHYLAKKIIGLMPPRCKTPNNPRDDGWLHYVEPYFGGGSVLLAQDPEGISEVVNDINDNLAVFWRVLQSPAMFQEFVRRLRFTPFSSDEFWDALGLKHSPVDRALAMFVKSRQSLAGRGDSFSPLTKNRTRRGMNEQVSAWLSAVDGIAEVHMRLRRVVILNEHACDVIRQQDGPRTLFYLDPPYLHSTRESDDTYENEMSDDEHGELLEALGAVKGRFLLSGYRSDLYDKAAETFGWKRHEFRVPNQAAGGKKKRTMTECVWTNY